MRYLTDGQRHLICEPFSIANLHAMAAALGIKRCWFHRGKFPHYDIPKLRQSEIEARCEIVSAREIVRTVQSALNTDNNKRHHDQLSITLASR